jgi:peptide/nickel transport system ATP-binding protein
MALLEVDDLRVSFATPDGTVSAVRGVSFTVTEGQTLGIVGESGSGKSVATQTIVGLTRGAKVSGSARFEGRELLGASPAELRSVRGAKIAMIFQDPLSSLHPQHKIGWQITEMIRAHERVSRAQARARAVDLLGLVGIPEPGRRVDDYPHQFSGGMRQRAMIAMALALNPRLLIADEPTTALDVTVQAQILALLEDLQKRLGMAIIIITHDLGVVAEIADDIAVMYAGRIVERGTADEIFHHPQHPYTWGLLTSIPRLDNPREEELVPISGRPPSLISLPSGCHFHPRCPYLQEAHKRVDPRLEPVNGGSHMSACLLPASARGQIWEGLQSGRDPASLQRLAAAAVGATAPPADAPALHTHGEVDPDAELPGEGVRS